jgi:phage terminase large subunit
MGNVGNALNDVLSGIRTVSSLLATDRLLVSDRCTNLVDQIPAYVWDPKATLRGEDKPIKAEDDEVDALRYAIFSTRALWQNVIRLTETPMGVAA